MPHDPPGLAEATNRCRRRVALRRIPTTLRDDDLTVKRHLALLIAALASLAFVGAALAHEAEDPVLQPVDPAEDCTEETTPDEGGDVTDAPTDDTSEDPALDDTEGCEDDASEIGEDGDEAVEAQELESAEDPAEDDAEDDADGERKQNHGWYVSEATKTCPEQGPERGACISEVARSDAGKDHATSEGTVDDGGATEDADADAGDAPSRAKPKAKPSKGRGGASG